MRVVALLAALGGCGEAPPICNVQADPTICWPDVTRVPHGSVSLGTGRDAFEPMPEVLPLEYGPQNGYDLMVNVRMTGFEPGDPVNILDPSNPRTRIRAFFADTNVPLDHLASCPTRTAYARSSTGDYELGGTAVVFETCWRSDHLFGKQIRIELELMDDCGHYAADTKTVTAAPPTSGMYPIDQDTPGCMHAADL
jgi:hypothetical protein